jgi:hypothetical protein
MIPKIGRGFRIFLRMHGPRLEPGQAKFVQPFGNGSGMHRNPEAAGNLSPF